MEKLSAHKLVYVSSWRNFADHLWKFTLVYGTAACKLNAIHFIHSCFSSEVATDHKRILVRDFDYGAYLTSSGIYRHVLGNLECLE